MVDSKPLFDESPGLAPLRNPEDFSKAIVDDKRGCSVDWPDFDIQIGAGTHMARRQNSKHRVTQCLIAEFFDRQFIALGDNHGEALCAGRKAGDWVCSGEGRGAELGNALGGSSELGQSWQECSRQHQ
jgi:hypothetical protein